MTMTELLELLRLVGVSDAAAATPAPNDAPIGEYVIIRGSASGCHAGTLVSADYATESVKLRNARRLWRYRGCETLSELAVYGASRPAECRFAPVVADQSIIGDVCEIIVCQAAGRTMIEAAPEWCV